MSSSAEPAKRNGILSSLALTLPYVRPWLPRMFVGALSALGATIVALVIPMVMRVLVDGPLAEGNPEQVLPFGLLILGLGIAEAVCILLRRFMVTGPSTMIEATMRNSLYAKLQRLQVSFHDRWQSGQLLSRAVQDLGRLRRFLAFGAIMFTVNMLTIVIGMGVLFYWSWLLGLAFLVINAPILIITYRFERQYWGAARLSQDQTGDLATTVEQSVHGIRVLKAFGRGPHALAGFTTQASDLQETEIRKAKFDATLSAWLTFIPLTSYAVCLFLGVWLVQQEVLTVGQLVAFFATAVVLTFPIESLGFLYAFSIEAASASVRFREVMDADETIHDPEEATTIARPEGRLEFRDVHFRYDDAGPQERDLVDGASLVIEPGETMALIGVTGSGKTTLTALPSRLYDVTQGQVLLDGVDVRDLTLKELRTHIAMAFEDATLFSRSVTDNVLLGSGSDDNPELVEKSLQIAQASFVHDLPEGLETQIGEEGMSLSGGQRQRLALARAVAAEPAVLVLDDPLSALDVETEAQVEDALRTVLASTTALIVAHRPSTVQLADRVALMREGRIDDVGTHSELLARNAHYRYVISSLEEETRKRKGYQ